MNNENDKKWFIYVNDHHEGPFTVTEVNEKKKSGLVTNESYVWCEGMNDWLMLNDVKELAQELKKLQPAPAPIAKAQTTTSSSGKTSSGIQSLKKAPVAAASPVVEPSKSETSAKTKYKKLPFILGATAAAVVVLGFGLLAALSRLAPEDLHAKLRPTLSKLSDNVPIIGSAFHLVPTLTDVTADEQRDLEAARSGAPDAGVKVAVALSQLDSNRPAFYISTNLPDRTKFDVYLVGNSETLLNKLTFNAQNTVTTAQGFGKSEVFVSDGGQLIPKGEYSCGGRRL